MADEVAIEVAEGIATIRFERPPMNALSIRLQEGLRDAARDVSGRRDVDAVIVYGGPKVFAAGADVKEMAEWTLAEALERTRGLQDAFTAIERIPQPTIAAVTGFALGGGCELAMCCDFRVAGDNAKLGQPEILLGIIPGAGGTQRLPRLVGVSRAKDLILSGRFVGADEALSIGLVDRVVAPESVYDEALAWARQLAAGPRLAMQAAKVAIARGMETDLEDGLEIERVHFASLFGTRDREIGMRSFIDKGPGQAEFTGS
jgi:enoyl-CoA hydratase/carnithine racemase